MKDFKQWLRNCIPDSIKKFVSYSIEVEYGRQSFSQFGEDIFLLNYFDQQPPGFYLDIGANHPIKCSNTYLLYKMGWSGIVVEPTPSFQELFKEFRPKDTFVGKAISEMKEEFFFYRFAEPLQNTLSRSIGERIKKSGVNKLTRKDIVQTTTLENILDEFLPKGQTIKFASIDAEGFDLKILKSNNWDKYRPSYILIEDPSKNIDESWQSEINKFLMSKDYEYISRPFHSSFFRDINSISEGA